MKFTTILLRHPVDNTLWGRHVDGDDSGVIKECTAMTHWLCDLPGRFHETIKLLSVVFPSCKHEIITGVHLAKKKNKCWTIRKQLAKYPDDPERLRLPFSILPLCDCFYITSSFKVFFPEQESSLILISLVSGTLKIDRTYIVALDLSIELSSIIKFPETIERSQACISCWNPLEDSIGGPGLCSLNSIKQWHQPTNKARQLRWKQARGPEWKEAKYNPCCRGPIEIHGKRNLLDKHPYNPHMKVSFQCIVCPATLSVWMIDIGV